MAKGLELAGAHPYTSRLRTPSPHLPWPPSLCSQWSCHLKCISRLPQALKVPCLLTREGQDWDLSCWNLALPGTYLCLPFGGCSLGLGLSEP